MKLKLLLALSFTVAAALSALAQSTEPVPNVLKPGSPAPVLEAIYLTLVEINHYEPNRASKELFRKGHEIQEEGYTRASLTRKALTF